MFRLYNRRFSVKYAAKFVSSSSSSSSCSSSSTHRYQAWLVKKLYSNACSTKFFLDSSRVFLVTQKKGWLLARWENQDFEGMTYLGPRDFSTFRWMFRCHSKILLPRNSYLRIVWRGERKKERKIGKWEGTKKEYLHLLERCSRR